MLASIYSASVTATQQPTFGALVIVDPHQKKPSPPPRKTVIIEFPICRRGRSPLSGPAHYLLAAIQDTERLAPAGYWVQAQQALRGPLRDFDLCYTQTLKAHLLKALICIDQRTEDGVLRALKLARKVLMEDAARAPEIYRLPARSHNERRLMSIAYNLRPGKREI